jgi:dTDP-glucose 4,6-dehydratase
MKSVPQRSEALLVTGGAGFIGANLVRHLLEHGAARLVVLDKLSYAGHRESLAELEGNSRFTFVQGDIGDRALVGGLLERERPRAILNLAAETHVDRSIDDASAFVNTNVVGSFGLLEAVRAHWVRLPAAEQAAFRLLHVSTDEVYGSIAPGQRADERAPLAPSSPYSASKAAADQLMLAWHHTYGLPVLVTHSANNFGPFQHPEKLIPLMLLNALEGRPLPLYGDGKNERDWLYVEDHCEALLRVLERGRPGERYNVGVGRECTNHELVTRLCTLLEEERPAHANPALREQGIPAYAALVRFVADRPGHDRRYALDAGKIAREIGWQPRHDLEGALRATVRWYLANAAWCGAVGHDRQRLGLGERARA